MKNLLSFLLFFSTQLCMGQAPSPVSLSGSIGVGYEYYGLHVKPATWTGFQPRRPWNQLRFNLQPILKFSRDFSIPINFNFVTKPTNFAGPYAGLQKQSFGQYITNPVNNFGINPTYKWAQLQLGTQYLRYSDLSTGDIGIFGGGVDLKPGIYRLKFFSGISQQPVNHVPGPVPPGVQGAYKRKHWMLQGGVEKEDEYRLLLNIARGEDRYSILTSPPPTIKPQEGVVVSFIADKFFKGGWYLKTEGAQSAFTKDLYQMPANNFKSFEPFISGRASTQKDYAATFSAGRKSALYDVGYSTKYIGAGFQTTGYPYMQQDHWDNTINTRFFAWNKKINVVASAGLRTNNIGNTTLQSQQFIGNLNWFTQFSDRFSLNVNYNNFGFTAASGTNPYGIRNVSNDFGVAPSYTWSNEKAVHLLTLSYNFSKYDERDVVTGVVTANNTHTALLSYIPTFLQKEITPEFSVLYFNNAMPLLKNTFVTLSSGISLPAAKKKMQLRSQLQYTIGKLNKFSSNNNFIASVNMDYKLTSKLIWNTFFTSNYFRYGNELGVPAFEGANYLETTMHTGFRYQF